MQFILKIILRNITVKPLRTAVIVLCLAAVSLTFSLCLTISVSSKAAVEEQVRSGNGRADIVLNSGKGFTELPVLPDECDSLPVLLASSYFQIHDINNYKYVQKKNIKVLGIDTAKAQELGMLPECTTPKDGEAVISYSVAQRYGYEVGDTMTLPCAYKTEVTLTVSEIVLNKGLLSIMQQTVIVTEDTARSFLSEPELKATMLYIDAPDGMTSEIADQLSEMYPELIVQQLTGTAETEDMIESLTRTFFILFIVTLLMILFIITAFAKNIAAERLSVIGTLRSIGAEKKTAAFTLLSECAVYGLLGEILGTVLFYALKDMLVGNMIPSVNGLGGSVSVPYYIPLTGLLLTAAISCIVSLSTVIRTSKTPVRDIIFRRQRQRIPSAKYCGSHRRDIFRFRTYTVLFADRGYLLYRWTYGVCHRYLPYCSQAAFRSIGDNGIAHRRRQAARVKACCYPVRNEKDSRHGHSHLRGGHAAYLVIVYTLVLGG